MNIINTTLTKTAEETTSNATYHIEFATVNDVLTRINASVWIPDKTGYDKQNIGYITCENGNVFCNLNRQVKASVYFLDFERFIEEIKENTSEMQISENSKLK